jgi:hypothetical protein
MVSRDYADLESHVARILCAANPAAAPAPEGGLVLALAEGRLLQWLASERPLNTLVASVATDLATLTAVSPARLPGSA